MESRSRSHPGFTLVEITVVISITLIIMLMMFDSIWSMFIESNAQRIRLSIDYDKQTALSIIESDVSTAAQFAPSLDSGISDVYAPSGGWSYVGTSSTNRNLILSAYSTTTNPLDNNRSPAFIGDASAGQCDAAHIYLNDIQRYDIVYFVQNGNLYRRKLVNANAKTCASQYEVTSCPSLSDLSSGTRDASCKADDELILKHVTQFSIDYYGLISDTVPLSAYSGNGSSYVNNATNIAVTITVSMQTSGKSITSQSVWRVVKLN